MPRPTLLVAEPEPLEALSVRKLVLETGKFNVLTAHSTREALDLFHMFPNLSAVILAGPDRIECDAVAKAVKSTTPKVPIVYLQMRIGSLCGNCDHVLPSDEPQALLELMRSLLGDPRSTEPPSSRTGS